MMRWWLAVLRLCAHPHTRRERDAQDVLELVCDRCGRRVPALARTDAERLEMAQRFPPPRTPTATTLPARKRTNVEAFRTAAR